MRARAVLAAVLIAGLAAPVVATGGWFSDVEVDHPNRAAIAWARDAGLFLGYRDGSFRPGEDLSEVQLRKVVERLFGKQDSWTRADTAQFLYDGWHPPARDGAPAVTRPPVVVEITTTVPCRPNIDGYDGDRLCPTTTAAAVSPTVNHRVEFVSLQVGVTSFDLVLSVTGSEAVDVRVVWGEGEGSRFRLNPGQETRIRKVMEANVATSRLRVFVGEEAVIDQLVARPQPPATTTLPPTTTTTTTMVDLNRLKSTWEARIRAYEQHVRRDLNRLTTPFRGPYYSMPLYRVAEVEELAQNAGRMHDTAQKALDAYQAAADVAGPFTYWVKTASDLKGHADDLLAFHTVDPGEDGKVEEDDIPKDQCSLSLLSPRWFGREERVDAFITVLEEEGYEDLRTRYRTTCYPLQTTRATTRIESEARWAFYQATRLIEDYADDEREFPSTMVGALQVILESAHSFRLNAMRRFAVLGVSPFNETHSI